MSARALAPALLALPLLAACGANQEEDDDTVYAPATVGGVLESLPACQTADADGRLDLVTGCVGEACVGHTLDELEAALGVEPACVTPEGAAGISRCTFEDTLIVELLDSDGDGWPDKGAEAEAIELEGPWASTPEGLGVGASTSCFLQVYGEPDTATWSRLNGVWVLTEAHWYGWGLTVVDDDGPPGSVDPDGQVDALLTEGAR
jgi:hypothetical protein